MLITKLLFIVLIIICFVFYIMYLWDFGLVLLVVMSAVPVIMFITTYIAKRNIHADFAVKDPVIPKNTEFPVQLVITNNSIFPVGRAETTIEYYNVFNNQITSFELSLPIQSKNTQRVTIQISSKFCGIVKIRTDRLTIYDPLRIFKFKIARDISAEIAVLPETHEIGGIVTFTDRINDESDRFSDYKSGDDPSEIFDLREYIPGDKLNRIHWKLSSKKDEFIVKEFSLPVDIPCRLFLNLRCYEDSDFTLPVFDTLMESFLSVSQFLIENERPHSVVFYSAKLKAFTERNIADSDELTELTSEIILSVRDNLYCEEPMHYFSENPVHSLSSFTFITSVPNDDILRYIEDETDADIKNAVVVVKNYEDAEGMKSDTSELNIIPVVIGKVSASIKDLEI